MPQFELVDEQLEDLAKALRMPGEDGLSIDERVRRLQQVRASSHRFGSKVDTMMVEEIGQLSSALEDAKEVQEDLREIVDRLSASPFFPAVYFGPAEVEEGPAGVVWYGNGWRVVTLASGVDPDSLKGGDEVLLNASLNCVIGLAPVSPLASGQASRFDRWTADGRLVIEHQDEEVVVFPTAGVTGDLKQGDLVRWSSELGMAFERVEKSNCEHLFLETTPEQTFEDIGGLEEQIEFLRSSVLLHLTNRDLAQRYGVQRRGGILLKGRSGMGKTMLARALANWLASVAGVGEARFMNIKPSSLHSVWYSQTEANYRQAFEIARRAGCENPDVPVVMFFDEVDSIGAARTEGLERVGDRVLTALMAELDGLDPRGNVLVVAATNRADALDPALLRPGRLGDAVLEVPRPNRDAARAIFGKYPHDGLPFAGTGRPATEACEILTEAALAAIFEPNGGDELAVLTMSDGSRRVVNPPQLISGASIRKIVVDAAERACLREIENGLRGLRLEDVLWSVQHEMDRSVRPFKPPRLCRGPSRV